MDDETLTETGLTITGDAPAPERVCIIACGALAREILALRDRNGWGHLDLRCLPAKLHNYPDQIPERVREAIGAARRDGYGTILIGYADCGTGGLLDRVCEEEGVERIAGPHCYAFFDGVDAFVERSAEEEMGAFFLTDFLARQFDTLIWRGFGLDRSPVIREMMFAHYDRVVYLAQTDDPALEQAARDAAARLELRFEKRHTGYGELASFMADAAARPLTPR